MDLTITDGTNPITDGTFEQKRTEICQIH